jgi:hypothetical protein
MGPSVCAASWLAGSTRARRKAISKRALDAKVDLSRERNGKFFIEECKLQLIAVSGECQFSFFHSASALPRPRARRKRWRPHSNDAKLSQLGKIQPRTQFD